MHDLSASMTAYRQFKRDKSSPIHVPPEGPTLIIYNYFESPLANKNAAFFFRHHKPEWADVLFIVNGKNHLLKLPSWVITLPRENIGMEFCAMIEILPLLLFRKLFDQEKRRAVAKVL